jgi:hypothetical protein
LRVEIGEVGDVDGTLGVEEDASAAALAAVAQAGRPFAAVAAEALGDEAEASVGRIRRGVPFQEGVVIARLRASADPGSAGAARLAGPAGPAGSAGAVGQ